MDKLILKIEHVNDPELPESERYIGVMHGAGIIVTGKDAQDVWKELMISLGVWIAHNSGLDYKALTQPETHYGLYQLCPKCEGEKVVPSSGTSTTRTCPLCSGAGVIQRPIIDKNSNV